METISKSTLVQSANQYMFHSEQSESVLVSSMQFHLEYASTVTFSNQSISALNTPGRRTEPTCVLISNTCTTRHTTQG